MQVKIKSVRRISCNISVRVKEKLWHLVMIT